MTRFFCSSWTAWRFCYTFSTTSCLGRLSRGHRVEACCFTRQQAVAVNIRKTALRLVDVHKRKTKPRRLLGNKLPSVPHRMVFVANFRLITGHDYHHRHLNRIGLTLRRLMSCVYIYIYIYGAPILDVSRSHTATQHSR